MLGVVEMAALGVVAVVIMVVGCGGWRMDLSLPLAWSRRGVEGASASASGGRFGGGFGAGGLSGAVASASGGWSGRTAGRQAELARTCETDPLVCHADTSTRA